MLELLLILVVALIGLGFAGYLAYTIMEHDEGSSQMKEIAHAIQEGAMAFLHREYKILLVFILIKQACHSQRPRPCS